MKLYGGYIEGIMWNGQTNSPVVVSAVSLEQAERDALLFAVKRFPKTAGYQSHGAHLIEVTEAQIAQVTVAPIT